MPALHLNGFTFQELQTHTGLKKLDDAFLNSIKQHHTPLYETILHNRTSALNHKQTQTASSQFLIDCAPLLEAFIEDLFNIKAAVSQLHAETLSHKPIFAFKSSYVKKAKQRLRKKDSLPPLSELNAWVDEQLQHQINTKQLSQQLVEKDKELAIASMGQNWMQSSSAEQSEKIERLTHWCIQVLNADKDHTPMRNWTMFTLPQSRPSPQEQVPVEPVHTAIVGQQPHYRLQSAGLHSSINLREGFQLTDRQAPQRNIQSEVHYCIYCHKNQTDFCSKGFPLKKGENEHFKTGPLNQLLIGCPLEEHVSEMHYLKSQGYAIGSLAVAMVENPLCAATGQRICNDCMQSCIYQKQDPVNIPQIETSILKDVLNLPWGVEIYDLMIRWNPLRPTQWIPKPYNGLKILVMGMGPAGFTLAHHLLMEGFAVVGADGLKIEPLPKQLIQQPIYAYADIEEPLDKRIIAGFGGVAEYGITARWDKNFLKLIYLSLVRRPYFQVFGGVRFGGSLTVEDAWELGFDHLSVAVGAGLPKELPIPGSLAPGMRQANDFLMALHTGASKPNSLIAMHIRLPALIIGGGLTGVDAATEVQAYYIKQVEQILDRYEKLSQYFGESLVLNAFPAVEQSLLKEALEHGRAVRKARLASKQTGKKPNFNQLIRQWGGVTIIYRRKMYESPAYQQNYEELKQAMREGIYYLEGLEPHAAQLDKDGQIQSLICQVRKQNDQGKWESTDQLQTLQAGAVLVATGARLNIAYGFEHKGTFARSGWQYQTFKTDSNQSLIPIDKQAHCKAKDFGPFTSYQKTHYRVTFIGDTHPAFHGSVVKAMASGKKTYPAIVKLFNKRTRASSQSLEKDYATFAKKIDTIFTARLIRSTRISKDVIELWIQAPLATKNYQPGHFYRIQNFESDALQVAHTQLHSEAIALTAVSVDKEKGLLRFIILEVGASSRLASMWKPSQALSVMGPTGVRSKLPKDPQAILLISDRLGIPESLSIGTALRKLRHRVIIFVILKDSTDCYLQEEIESIFHHVIWVTKNNSSVKPHQAHHYTITNSNIIEALVACKDHVTINLRAINHISAIGGATLIQAVQLGSRQANIKAIFPANPEYTGSVYGPMQCMLKGVCAQCLQWQIDPQTGKRTKAVFSCSWQNQPLTIIDTKNVNERLRQNRTQEILNNLWLDYCLKQPINSLENETDSL